MSSKKVNIVFLFLLIFNLTIVFSSTPVYASTTPEDTSADITVETNSESVLENQSESEFKAEILRLVNIEREKQGINKLETLDILNDIGDLRAKESAVSFSHTRTNGSSNFTVFSEFSLSYRSAGENLGYGYSTAQELMDAWMDSPSHKKNILSDRFNYIGIGYYLKENGKIYCSQIFYTPKGTLED